MVTKLSDTIKWRTPQRVKCSRVTSDFSLVQDYAVPTTAHHLEERRSITQPVAMSQDFKKYLATEVLSEQRTISYRNVARTLKVHVNAAKCMLYDFYEFQNSKKPGSIYATYLLSGIKKRPTLAVATNGINGHKNDYEADEHIPSSPPPFTSSMLEPSQESSHVEEEEAKLVPVRTITLVREEALEGMLMRTSDTSYSH